MLFGYLPKFQWHHLSVNCHFPLPLLSTPFVSLTGVRFWQPNHTQVGQKESISYQSGIGIQRQGQHLLIQELRRCNLRNFSRFIFLLFVQREAMERQSLPSKGRCAEVEREKVGKRFLDSLPQVVLWLISPKYCSLLPINFWLKIFLELACVDFYNSQPNKTWASMA